LIRYVKIKFVVKDLRTHISANFYVSDPNPKGVMGPQILRILRFFNI